MSGYKQDLKKIIIRRRIRPMELSDKEYMI